MPSARDFLSLVVFAHTVFALPFALLRRSLRRAASRRPDAPLDPRRDGRGPLGGDVVQPDRRPADRREEPADRAPRDPGRDRVAGRRRPLLRRLGRPLRPRRRAAEPSLPVPLARRPRDRPRLLVRQALHPPRAPRPRPRPRHRPGRGVDRGDGAPSPFLRSSSASRSSSGSPASTSSTASRTRSSTGPRGSAPSRRASGARGRSRSPASSTG